MIRINLLGLPKPKKGKRAGGGAGVPMEGPPPMLIAVVVLVLTVAANGYYYYKLDKDAKEIAKKTQEYSQKNAELANLKTSYENSKRFAELYERRVKVIDQLRADQAGPVKLLATISDTVNTTDAVWLIDMQEDQNKVDLNGVALSTQAVANLIANLKKTGYFRTVEIKETVQDDRNKDVQAFTFQLSCEKKKS